MGIAGIAALALIFAIMLIITRSVVASAVIVGTVLFYIALSERIGFLLIAPLCLMTVFLALRVSWQRALPWAIGGTVVVHLAFYKLLRVPLPWGWITPFY